MHLGLNEHIHSNGYSIPPWDIAARGKIANGYPAVLGKTVGLEKMMGLAGQPGTCVFTVALGGDPGRRIPLFIGPKNGMGPCFFLLRQSYYDLIGASERKQAQEQARTKARTQFSKQLAKHPSRTADLQSIKARVELWKSPEARE